MSEGLDAPHPPDPDHPARARAGGNRRRRRLLAGLVVAAVAVAVGIALIVSGGPDRVGAPAGHSGVIGVALVGPTCPVEGAGKDCGNRPAQGTVLVQDRASGAAAATVQTGADGRFRVALPPGEYVVTASSQEAESCGSIEVTVARERYAEVEILCDSGIL